MLNDYQILKDLGMVIEGQKLIFFDDDEQEYVFDFSDISRISYEQTYTPFYVKLSYWIHKIFVSITIAGMPSSKSYLEDFSQIYNLDIEMTNKQVISRTVKGIFPVELEELLMELNKLFK
jgi:hypothetical protein